MCITGPCTGSSSRLAIASEMYFEEEMGRLKSRVPQRSQKYLRPPAVRYSRTAWQRRQTLPAPQCEGRLVRPQAIETAPQHIVVEAVADVGDLAGGTPAASMTLPSDFGEGFPTP